MDELTQTSQNKVKTDRGKSSIHNVHFTVLHLSPNLCGLKSKDSFQIQCGGRQTDVEMFLSLPLISVKLSG